MTVDQFLAWLEEGPEGARYELVACEVVAMAPERAAHARLKAEVWLALREGIRSAGLACEAWPDGMTIKIIPLMNPMPSCTADRGSKTTHCLCQSR
jgi:Uma2 family endonuclease